MLSPGSCSAQHTLTPARLANGTAVFIQPENLKEHFKLTKEEGADGMVVWGDAGPHVSARPGARHRSCHPLCLLLAEKLAWAFVSLEIIGAFSNGVLCCWSSQAILAR